MSNLTRREQQRQKLVDDILTEARALLEGGGPSAISLRAIARSVGMSAPSLYTYFPSLNHLITELIVQSYQSLADAVSDALEDGSGQTMTANADDQLNARQRLGAGPRAYRQWALANRQQFNLIFFDQISGYQAPDNGPTVAAQTRVLQPIGVEFAVATGRDATELETNDELLDDFLAWWGSFHGLVALEVNHHYDWRDPSSIFERWLDTNVTQLLSQTPM